MTKYTVADIAKKLPVTKARVYGLVRKGRIHSVKEGRRVWVTEKGLKQALQIYSEGEAEQSSTSDRYYCIPCGSSYDEFVEKCPTCSSKPYDTERHRRLCTGCLRPYKSKRRRVCRYCSEKLRDIRDWPRDIKYR